MKLKTLKDFKNKNNWVIQPLTFFAKAWRQGNSILLTVPSTVVKNYKIRPRDRMEIIARLISDYEWKNRREIVRKRFIGYDIFSDLRQEAIKWIKGIREAEKFTIDEWLTKNGYDNQMDDFVNNPGVIRWIRWFFNIAEKELK